MGQYYKIVDLTNKVTISGLGKLMEFSWSVNENVLGLQAMLADDEAKALFPDNPLIGSSCGSQIAVVGDYAESESAEKWRKSLPTQTLQDDEEPSLYGAVGEFWKEVKVERDDRAHEQLAKIFYKNTFYLFNRTLNQYVDLAEYKRNVIALTKPSEKDWVASAITILCADGNGLGGGDYHGAKEELNNYVGSWAYSAIELKVSVPEGAEEIKPVFVESHNFSPMGAIVKQLEYTPPKSGGNSDNLAAMML